MKKHLLLLMLFPLFCSAQPCSLPDSLFKEDTIVVCSGTTYQLQAPTFASTSYKWNGGQTGTSYSVTTNGKYWLTVSQPNCTITDSVTILFNSFLLSPEVHDLKLCKGQATAMLPVTGQQLLWYNDPIAGTGSSSLPLPTTVDTGRATYWLTQTIRGCESPRVPLRVKVIDKPKFELGNPYIIPCGTSAITLQVVPDGESRYTWSNGSNGSSMTATGRGKYSLYGENMCGNFRDTVMAVECSDRCVQFANAFTPNGDGKNETYSASCFCPVPKYNLVIYNRNGEKVFQTTDPSKGWDGSYLGKQQPAGAFIYYSQFYDFVLKQDMTEKGSFVLLR